MIKDQKKSAPNQGSSRLHSRERVEPRVPSWLTKSFNLLRHACAAAKVSDFGVCCAQFVGVLEEVGC